MSRLELQVEKELSAVSVTRLVSGEDGGEGGRLGNPALLRFSAWICLIRFCSSKVWFLACSENLSFPDLNGIYCLKLQLPTPALPACAVGETWLMWLAENSAMTWLRVI